ncbi:MAG: DUF2723 domain-containing protein [Chloroflexi bacterium]|nr:DUF2723 domain-containing protein [Chloroflexota bacterium]
MPLVRRIPPQHVPAFGLFVATAALYLLTLAPTITQRHFGGDGAELATAAHTLGVAHPSGYPTYLLLAKAVSLLLPWGDTAHRLNVFSALSGAGTVVLVYYTVRVLLERLEYRVSYARHSVSVMAATLAAASLAVSPLFWSQSLITEVYSLGALFAASLVLLMLMWSIDPYRSWRLLPLSAFVLGLGLGNHLVLLLILPSLAYFIVLHRERLTRRVIWCSLGTLLIGLSVYLYLPVAAAQDPPISWGDARGVDGFLWEVLATPYRKFAFGLPLGDLPGRVVEWADLLVRQFNVAGLFVGIIGVWRLRVSSLPLLLFTGLLFVSSVVYSLMYHTDDAQVYLLAAFVVFALWIGVGLYWTVGFASELVDSRLRLPVSPLIALGVASFLLVPGLTLALNRQDMDISGDRESLRYAQRIVESVEPDSVILADAEHELFPLWYYIYVVKNGSGPVVLSTRLIQFDWYLREQQRRDPESVPAEVAGGYIGRLAQIVEYNLGRRPVYATLQADYLLAQFEGEPEGNIFRLLRRRE